MSPVYHFPTTLPVTCPLGHKNSNYVALRYLCVQKLTVCTQATHNDGYCFSTTNKVVLLNKTRHSYTNALLPSSNWFSSCIGYTISLAISLSMRAQLFTSICLRDIHKMYRIQRYIKTASICLSLKAELQYIAMLLQFLH